MIGFDIVKKKKKCIFDIINLVKFYVNYDLKIYTI